MTFYAILGTPTPRDPRDAGWWRSHEARAWNGESTVARSPLTQVPAVVVRDHG